MAVIHSLPTITRFLYIQDHGPSDDGQGSTTCPHCGAHGRYVHHFIVEDGSHLAAMSGCVKLFPASPVAVEHQKLEDKLRKLQADYGKDAHLNTWDTRKMEAIEGFYGGEITEEDALRTIKMQTAAAAAWRQKKYGGRR